MRIGIFTDTYPPYINGVSTSILMLEQALIKKGHSVYIVTVNSENYTYQDSDRVIRIPGIPIGIYDYRLTGVYPLKAISKIKKWKLDVIHSHTEFGVGTFARIMARQFNIPLVHTYHTMYEDYVHYVTKGYFLNTGKKIVEHLTKFYCDYTATELIVPTKKAYDLFKEKYKVDKNIHIVPTGIEVSRFYKENSSDSKIMELREKLNIKESIPVILYVGRIAKEKSIDFLIENHLEILKQNKALLLIVGGGPEIEEYKLLVNKLKLKDNVLFTDKVPFEEMPLYYQLATIFVTASRTETQGLTIIEAMAVPLPVVAADDESFKTVVVDGLNGNLFSNKKEYIKAITTLLNDSELLSRMSKQARIISEAHSSKHFAEQVLAVYRKAIGPKRKKTFKDKFKSIFRR